MPYSPEQPQHRRPVVGTGGTEAAYRHARDNDPNVTFGVRMRLHSLELAKASTSEPYTFAIELSAHDGGSALRSRTSLTCVASSTQTKTFGGSSSTTRPA